MSTPTQAFDARWSPQRAVEAAIRIGLVFLLAAWCYLIVAPFVIPILWGLIIAVACHPMYRWIAEKLAGRRRLAAILFTLLALAVLITPTAMLVDTLAGSARMLSAEFHGDTLRIPPPPASIAKWPVIGEQLSSFWSGASENLEGTLRTVAPYLKDAGGWLISTAAGAGAGLLQFIIAIVIAGVFLAQDVEVGSFMKSLATRLTGDRGEEFAALTTKTVRSVAQGVLGVAVIQTLLAAVGLLAVGVPGAGLWALLILLVAIVQLPTLIILGPVMVYVFYTSSTTVAVLFTIWSLLAGSSDTILRPLLLGRGVEVPMLIILIGSIGGMIHSGIIGLFVGAVVLALSYQLFKAWLAEGSSTGERGTPSQA